MRRTSRIRLTLAVVSALVAPATGFAQRPAAGTVTDAMSARSSDAARTDASASPAEVDLLRGEVEAALLAYNFDTLLWEWVSLGLWDVLAAMQARCSGAAFAAFYWRAMAIELREKH